MRNGAGSPGSDLVTFFVVVRLNDRPGTPDGDIDLMGETGQTTSPIRPLIAGNVNVRAIPI